MRNRIWNNLYNIKFKALYTCECSRRAESYSRLYSLFLALSSAGSIATWAIWKQIPSAWASLIAVSQILHVAKPYFPFIKNDKVFLEMSYEFESLYIEFEKLWYSFEEGKITNDEVAKKFYELRDKEISIEKIHQVHCPDIIKWKLKINEATDAAIALNFKQGTRQ